jgi:hypothetical protein
VSAAVELPTWAIYAVSFGTPVLTFIGVLIAQWIGRRAAKELETRSKREETLRVLRWAAELAVSDDDGKAKLGVSQLNALGDSDLLDDAQQLFVDAALEAVVDEPADEIEEAGEDAEVIRLPGPGAPPLPSDEDEEGGDDG